MSKGLISPWSVVDFRFATDEILSIREANSKSVSFSVTYLLLAQMRQMIASLTSQIRLKK